jgi:hypothetical protein
MIMLSTSRARRASIAGAFAFALATASGVNAANAAPQAIPATTVAAASQQLVPFAWLVGGAWRADTSTLPGGLKYIETRYDLAPNGRVLRFTTAFVNADGGVGNGYAGDLFFDPAANVLKMWYVDSKNVITQGPVTGDGAAWHMTFQSDSAVIGGSGQADFRVDVTRETNDAYAWGLFARVADAWKPVFSLRYVRTPDRNAG